MSLRPPRDEDVTVVAELMSEFARDRVDPETIERDWTSPIIDREHDVRAELHENVGMHMTARFDISEKELA
jgi:hypothetical protein